MLGSIATIDSPTAVMVEGVGLVGGLNQKGSLECPTDIRDYLKQYILSEIPAEDSISVDDLIDSLNTAVVLVEGIMPIEDSSKPYFDLKITAYRGTQTVSLENGWLYRTVLKNIGTFGIKTDNLADAEGPIFINQIDSQTVDKRTGYILGGGKNIINYAIALILKNADFALTNNIRNRLNIRFGRDTARAIKAGFIEISIPQKYKAQRGKFIELLKSVYVYDVPQNDSERINKHIQQITDHPESNEGEYALEAMGNQCLSQLSTLLMSPDEHVRLRAARCMLNLRSDDGMNALVEIILNRNSPYRIEALEAVTESGRPADASNLALELLKDGNFDIRLAAYRQLYKLNDRHIVIKPVASNFLIEKIEQSENKDIYVARSGQPQVVLFGTSIYCDKGFIINSANGEITIDAPADKDYVIVSRKFPNRPDLIGQIKCTYELDNIIQALCDDPPERGQDVRGGLGVSYSDLIVLLKQMCDIGAIDAEFHAGPMPKIDLNVKK